MQFSQRMKRLGTETAFEVLAKAKALEAQGHPIIHLEIGEPDFPSPQNIIDAACRALHNGYTHYSPSAGIQSLREVVAEHISQTRNHPVTPEQVVITPGAKPILFYCILSLIDPGDEVVMPDPGFPIYESVVRFVNGLPRFVPLREELGFRWDLNELKETITPQTRMLILNSPHNPTGGVLTAEDLKGIAEIVLENDVIVLADEIYSEILYEGRHQSLLGLPGMAERTILLDGFSKTYAMTGWRLGYGVMPEELAEHVTRLITNSVSCTATFTQIAGIEALRGPQDASRRMLEAFRERRDAIVDGLNKIPGFRCHRPQGAFYVFPNVKAFGKKSSEIADILLQRYHIAALSGTSFGPAGEGYIRFSYANSMDNIREALVRLEQASRELLPKH